MKRLLGLLCCGALLACNAIKLEDFPRPFACDHHGGDGGQQCAVGWACGFDDRCFQKDLVLDGGQFVEQWRCLADTHCPTGWQCGQEVDFLRHCQQLGEGAPSRCANDDGGCQGGWRCAAAQRCFDPADTDGGTERECTTDPQCPDHFRCGERVPGQPQRCVERGVGAPSACLTDQGCEGGFRCDTFGQRCVLVTDVLTTGQTASLGAQEFNPRRHEPAPLLLAMTRLSRVPSMFGGSSVLGLRPGLLMASLLADGGVRVVAQLREEDRSDAGPVLLFEKTWAVPGAVGEVTDLAVSALGPAVRFRDGGASRLHLSDGGWEGLGPTDFLRQRDPLDDQGLTALVRVSGNQVWVDGADGGVSFASAVREVIAVRESVFAFTTSGLFVSPGPDGGAAQLVMDAGLGAPSRGVVAGFVGSPFDPQLGAVVELASGLISVAPGMFGFFASPVLSACPDGSSPLQLAFDVDPNERQTVLSRCSSPDGGSFPVQVGLGNVNAEFAAVIEDQVPFQWGVVAQRSSPFVRAHAATDARLWHAVDPTQRSLLGRLPLKPLLLDRQPETMISFFEQPGQGPRVFAVSGSVLFVADRNGGFVSQLSENTDVPLSVLATNQSWVVTTTGVLITGGAKPRLMATMPAGSTFVAPASGVAVELLLGSRLRQVILVASGDTIWVADVTDARTGPFAQPAVFERVLVPVPGVRLRSMTLEPSSGGGLSGYLTTSTQNLRFGTTDLVRWSLSPVPTPTLDSLPLEVWAEPDGGPGRTGFTDGRVWSLPIMVPLTQPLVARDGGALTASDFARKCGDLFAATAEGLFRAEAAGPDGGLPRWVAVPSLDARLDSMDSLRFYETHDSDDRLFVGTQTGQVLELTAPSRCP